MNLFTRTLDRLAGQPGERGIAQGSEHLRYADLPEVFARLDGGPVGRADEQTVFAFTCEQSLAAAALLLYLLHRGRSMVLLPPLGGRYQAPADGSFVPAFCRLRLTAGPEPGEASVAENPSFRRPPAAVGGGGPRVFLRTSGSTQTPKIAVHPHDRLAANAAQCVARWRLRPEDRIAIPPPIFHMYGLGAALLPGVLAGGDLDLQPGANVLRYLEREEAFEPNVAFLTPGLVASFLQVRRNPRPYRFAVTAGDRVEPEVVERFEERFGPLLNLYGSTEMGALAAPSPETPPEARRTGSGLPMDGAQVRLLPLSASLPEASAPGAGRLQCRYEHGFAGYVDPEGRRQEGEPDGWLDTGDLASILPDGRLEILGRFGHSVNRDGLLVLFADVERALQSVDGVERAVVVAGEPGPRGRRLVAFCVPADRTATADEIRRRARRSMPAHVVPEEIRLRRNLPTLDNGKIDRRALVGEVLPATASASASPSPKSV